MRLFIIVALCVLTACNDKAPQYNDTPTSGKKTIIADNAFENTIMDSEAYIFHNHYPDAQIITKYAPEASVLNALLSDSIQGAIMCRPLTSKEKQHFISRRFEARESVIAVDALAFIVNPDNADSVLRYSDVLNILNGGTNHWEDIAAGNSVKGSIQLVLDNRNSGIVRFIIDSINKGRSLPSFASALNSNDEVIDYVSKNKRAIGVINVSRISNTYDSTQMSFLKKIRVCYITNPKDNEEYQPIAGYIALNKYPFTRKVYYINCEPYDGVVTGFGAFLNGDIGQIIVKCSGMMPGNARMTVRQVQVNKSF